MLHATLNVRLQEKIRQPMVVNTIEPPPSSSSQDGIRSYLLRHILRPYSIVFHVTPRNYDLVIQTNPRHLTLEWTRFPLCPLLFDVKLPLDLISLTWLVSDSLTFPRIQLDCDYEDMLALERQRMWEEQNDEDDEENTSENHSSTSNDDDDDQEGEERSNKTNENSDSASNSFSESDNSSIDTPPYAMAISAPRPTVASVSRGYWPHKLTKLYFYVGIHRLRIWTELVLNLPSTMTDLRLRPHGAWSNLNYGEDCEFFVENCWKNLPLLSSLRISHPEIRSQYAESASFTEKLSFERRTPWHSNDEQKSAAYIDPPPQNLESFTVKTYSSGFDCVLAVRNAPVLRHLAVKMPSQLILPDTLKFTVDDLKILIPRNITSLEYPGEIETRMNNINASTIGSEFLPESLTELTVSGSFDPLISSQRFRLRKLSFRKIWSYPNYPQVGSENSLNFIPPCLTELSLPNYWFFSSSCEEKERISLLPPTLRKLTSNEHWFSNIEILFQKVPNLEKFQCACAIPAFELALHPGDRSVERSCNLYWLWSRLNEYSVSGKFFELSTAMIFNVINEHFKGKLSTSISDSNLLYSNALFYRTCAFMDVQKLDWKPFCLNGLRRPELRHVDVLGLVPNLTSLNISLFTRNRDALLRAPYFSTLTCLTSLCITQEAPDFKLEPLSALPASLTRLRWITHCDDDICRPKFDLPKHPQFVEIDTPRFDYEYQALFVACVTHATLIRAVLSYQDAEFGKASEKFENPTALQLRVRVA